MKLFKKLFILVVLCFGIAFVSFSPSTQNVSARRCCSTCPGSGDPVSAEYYCPPRCASDDEACWQACVAEINQCYGYCMDCNVGNDPPTNRIECETYETFPNHYVTLCHTAY